MGPVRESLPGAVRGGCLAPPGHLLRRAHRGDDRPRGHGGRPSRPLGLDSRRGGTAASLARDARIGPADVDVVLLTHLDIDHLGWNTDLEGVPLFPRARYVVHADALACAMSRAGRAHIQRCVVPILDRFEQVRRDVELAPGITAFGTPGHSPGHLSLRISSEGAEATTLGDVAPHPALLDETGWRFQFDEDAEQNGAVRTALVDELRRDGGLVVCGHFPGSGIGRIAEHDGMVVWDEVSP